MSLLPGGVPAPRTDQLNEVGAEGDAVRKMSMEPNHAGIRERLWGLHARLDPSVTFEEYTYWAKLERDLEREEKRLEIAARGSGGGMFSFLKGKKKDTLAGLPAPDNNNNLSPNEKNPKTGELVSDDSGSGSSPIAPRSADLDAEWRQASRALRTASWSAAFYLITTDILGWGQTPYVFANTGYNLGAGMFVLFGFAAAASGWYIWRTFLALDSSRFPMVTYGDPFFRLFGPKTRHLINFAQSVQMFLSVCVILLGNTNVLAQVAVTSSLCYIVIAVINLIISMAGGFMRTLKHVGWFANGCVWINICSFIIIIVAAPITGPDPTYQVNIGILPKSWATDPYPVVTFAGTPPAEFQPTVDSSAFASNFNGIDSIVYAYAGAILFVAFLSEMRYPLDFWKGMFLAQGFIGVVYLFFGAFVYKWYGQYAYSTITQVVQPTALQYVSNILALVAGWIATWLYFNIGMKTVYIEVGQEIFKLPPITTPKGKFLWKLLGPFYWIAGFAVSMSVPEFNGFTSFVGGLFALNFTYSFSGIMYTALMTQEGARLPGEGFDPVTGVTTRHDSGIKRHVRGFLKNWKYTVPGVIFSCAGLAASGMGTWVATLALEDAFAESVLTSWTCVSPAKAT